MPRCAGVQKGELMATIIILGAGLTGLSTAYHLQKKGFSQVRLYEKQARPGGLLRSVTKNGFTFDHTGHLLHSSDSYFKDFLIDVAGLHTHFDYIERRAAIHTHETMVHYPFQMNLFGLPTEIIIDCITGFMKKKNSRKKPSSFYEWVLKYFGSGFAQHFFVPYNNKLLASSIKNITPSWTGRFVPQTSLDAVIEGALKDRYAGGVGYNSYFYYPKQGGIEYLIKRILQHIYYPIVTHSPAQAIDIKHKRVYFANGEQVNYDYLISTLPLDNLLLSLIEPSSSTLYKALDKLSCTSVINNNLGCKGAVELDKHWIYFPEKKFSFYRMGLWHNISTQLAPDGHSSLYVESSFLKNRMTKKQVMSLTERAKKQAFAFAGISPASCVVDETLLIDHAYVIYDQWREKNLPGLLDQLKQYGIYSVGRFGAWKYSSMQEAVLDGREVADQLACSLGVYHKENSLVL